MAWVRLSRGEADQGKLPQLCVRCGRPAVCWKRKKFPDCSVNLPWCSQHQYYWLLQALFIPGSMIAVVGLGLLTWSAGLGIHGGLLCLGICAALSIWLVIAILVERRAVRPMDVSLTELTLVGISPVFVTALVERHREQAVKRPPQAGAMFARHRQPRPATLKESVRLTRREALAGIFPSVCAVCGAQATVRRTKEFAATEATGCLVLVMFPLIVLGWPALFLGFLGEKKLDVTLPFCHDHRSHWSARSALQWGSFFLMLSLWVGTVPLIQSLASPNSGPTADPGPKWIWLTLAVLGIIWFTAVTAIQRSAIRANGLTDRSITLHNVSAAFVDALDPDYVIATSLSQATNVPPGKAKEITGGLDHGDSEGIYDPNRGTDIRPGGTNGPGSP